MEKAVAILIGHNERVPRVLTERVDHLRLRPTPWQLPNGSGEASQDFSVLLAWATLGDILQGTFDVACAEQRAKLAPHELNSLIDRAPRLAIRALRRRRKLLGPSDWHGECQPKSSQRH